LLYFHQENLYQCQELWLGEIDYRTVIGI
jgi:hypothetical protein